MTWELHRNVLRHYYHDSWLVELEPVRFRWHWVGMLYARWWIAFQPWGEAWMKPVEAPKQIEQRSGSPYRLPA